MHISEAVFWMPYALIRNVILCKSFNEKNFVVFERKWKCKLAQCWTKDYLLSLYNDGFLHWLWNPCPWIASRNQTQWITLVGCSTMKEITNMMNVGGAATLAFLKLDKFCRVYLVISSYRWQCKVKYCLEADIGPKCYRKQEWTLILVVQVVQNKYP